MHFVVLFEIHFLRKILASGKPSGLEPSFRHVAIRILKDNSIAYSCKDLLQNLLICL